MKSCLLVQATEELANGVDRSFDWESEVAELHQHIYRAQRLQSEQQLWHSWESAREDMAEEADWLKEQAFDAQHQVSLTRHLIPGLSADLLASYNVRKLLIITAPYIESFWTSSDVHFLENTLHVILCIPL